MEFLDPKKQRANLVRLIIGYILVGIALLLTTIILLYQAYGFGLKNGEVVQNGLIFISSRPTPADIYVNGQKNEKTTNTRLLLPAGQYTFRLERDGYRTWRRAIPIEGGSVARFDYPMLFPTTLVTNDTKKYDARPGIVTQSPDKRWLLVQNGSFNSFDLFDLADREKAPTPLTLPLALFDQPEGGHSWRFVEWASDNRHVLLQHLAAKDNSQASEYVLLDREEPTESANLTRTLGANPTQIELLDKKFDKYFLYDKAAQTLTTATLSEPAPQPLLENILAFKTHGDDVILYATDEDGLDGRAQIKLREGDRTYAVRQVAAGDAYLLNLARYEDNWYAVAGAPSENKTYVYKNPAAALRAKPRSLLVPVQVLKVTNAHHVSFSDNARFISVQGGQQFALYDAETDKGYGYAVGAPMDAPQDRAVWMDGHRLQFVSKGKTFVFDFDDANSETLAAADAAYTPVFDRDYEFMYTINPQTAKAADGTETTQFVLTNTALRTPRDQ
ncbi:MAG: PEGA domain-containing protein [Patescibacteria group bacterium]